MQVSNIRVNAMVRSVLTRHWIDLQKVKLESYRGTVRLSGEIHQLGSRAARVDPSVLSTIEGDLRRVPGVRRVHFSFTNCKACVGVV